MKAFPDECPKCGAKNDPDGSPPPKRVNVFHQLCNFDGVNVWEHHCRECKHSWLTKSAKQG